MLVANNYLYSYNRKPDNDVRMRPKRDRGRAGGDNVRYHTFGGGFRAELQLASAPFGVVRQESGWAWNKPGNRCPDIGLYGKCLDRVRDRRFRGRDVVVALSDRKHIVSSRREREEVEAEPTQLFLG